MAALKTIDLRSVGGGGCRASPLVQLAEEVARIKKSGRRGRYIFLLPQNQAPEGIVRDYLESQGLRIASVGYEGGALRVEAVYEG